MIVLQENITDLTIPSGDVVTNGDFELSSGWTFNNPPWSYNSPGTGFGNAFLLSSGEADQSIRQTCLTIGVTYDYTLQITNYASGNCNVITGTTTHATHSANGTFTGSFVAEGTDIIFSADTLSSSRFSITDIEIIADNGTDQSFTVIPRSYTADSIDIEEEGTDVVNNYSATFSRVDYNGNTDTTGNYLKITGNFLLREDKFYKLTVKNGSTVIYKDKIFCTNQTGTSLSYSINNGEYIDNTTDNDFIIYND